MRAELTDTLVSAAQQLESAIADLRSAGSADVATYQSQLADIIALKRGVATASPAALTLLGSQIASLASAANAAAQDASAKAGVANTQSAAGQLAQASDRARQAVATVMDGMKDFDSYLHFDSPEDERAYRERERERQEEIKREQAKGTPQGDLAAVGLAKAQLTDAGAHGADQSPEFQKFMGDLDGAGADLKAAMPPKSPDQAKQDQAEAHHDNELASAMAALSSAGVKGPPADDPAVHHGLQDATASSRVLSR